MSLYSKEAYTLILDQMLSKELCYSSTAASESNIKNAMKRVLGALIKQGILKRYDFLVLNENLNVFVTIIDQDNTEFSIELIYGV